MNPKSQSSRDFSEAAGGGAARKNMSAQWLEWRAAGTDCVKWPENPLQLCEGLLSLDWSEGGDFHMRSPRNSSQMAPQRQGAAECRCVWHAVSDKHKRLEKRAQPHPSAPLQGEVFALYSGSPGEPLESLNQGLIELSPERMHE